MNRANIAIAGVGELIATLALIAVFGWWGLAISALYTVGALVHAHLEYRRVVAWATQVTEQRRFWAAKPVHKALHHD